jgi:hypothetical protein
MINNPESKSLVVVVVGFSRKGVLFGGAQEWKLCWYSKIVLLLAGE